jgi:hypothetical protein
MSQTTFVNSRGVAHKGSGGFSIVFPDVCKTPAPPAPPIPIPYPNVGQASDTSSGPSAVKTDGKRTSLEKGYAFNAMRATGRQFHDAHERYSKAARRSLGNLAKKVEKRAEDCASKNGCPGSGAKGGKHKAPTDLKEALDNLSDVKIRPKLAVPAKGTKSPKPKKPWYTSPHSLQF